MQPLASRLRPEQPDALFGQDHLLGQAKPLHAALQTGSVHSMILWGPPGCGKTTLAKMLSEKAQLPYVALSAVLAGVKEIREVVAHAKLKNKSTVLFIDEIHRFNKSQQDALLPFVEDGTLILIGATTENPSFECNPALLSRTRVYVLKTLSDEALTLILNRALVSPAGLDGRFSITDAAQEQLVTMCQGDARKLLTTLEVVVKHLEQSISVESNRITVETIAETMDSQTVHFDKKGEHFYDQISALHKSVRGSDADAALYWYCRMLLGGCDLSYLSRRVIRMASEDIGNADPKALTVALDAAASFERLGQPEGELAIAQALVYLAVAPKSNAVYEAFNKAKDFAAVTGHMPVPNHLRNAPTKLMSQLGFGKNYRYDHDCPEGVAFAQNYFPEGLPVQVFYKPKKRGLEAKVIDKLQWLCENRHLEREKV